MEKQKWFNKEVDEVQKELEVNVENGLQTSQVKERQEKYGFNELEATKKKQYYKNS